MKKTHKEIVENYNMLEGRWEDLSVEEQIEYAFKLGFSWGIGTDMKEFFSGYC